MLKYYEISLTFQIWILKSPKVKRHRLCVFRRVNFGTKCSPGLKVEGRVGTTTILSKKKQFSHANLSVWFGLNIQNNKKISDILTHF